jgi:hypothetical protein
MPALYIAIQQLLLIARFFHCALLTSVYARIQAISQLAVALHTKRPNLRNNDAVRFPQQLEGGMEIRTTIFAGVRRESVVGGSAEYLEAMLQSHRRQRIAAAASDPSMCSKIHNGPLHSDAKAFL